MLERFTRPQFSDWYAPLGICGLLAALYAGGASVADALRYERGRILAGEAWRLVGGHLVHADPAHLAWNLAGILLVWWLFAAEYRLREWLLILVSSTAAIDLGFLLLQPELEWYVGFSGVLHGCMAAGLIAWLRRSRDPVVVTVAVLFVAKLLWEHLVGALPFTAGTLTVPVVHQAHTYGACGGALAGLWLKGRRSAGPAPL